MTATADASSTSVDTQYRCSRTTCVTSTAIDGFLLVTLSSRVTDSTFRRHLLLSSRRIKDILKDFLDPLRGRQHVPSKRRHSITLLLNITSKKTSILNKKRRENRQTSPSDTHFAFIFNLQFMSIRTASRYALPDCSGGTVTGYRHRPQLPLTVILTKLAI